jgi:hypothetical protein
MVALAVLSLLNSGCVVLAGVAVYGHTQWYSTTFVTPPAAVSADLPATGKNVSVRVEDMRTGVAGYEVGSKLTTRWGHEAATIDLTDKSLLANHISRDVVAALRQHGYRGVPMQESATEPAEMALTVRVHVFALIVSEGDRMDGEALVSFEALDPATGRRVGVDGVGVRVSALKGEYQALFDLLYKRLRDELVKRLPLVLQE